MSIIYYVYVPTSINLQLILSFRSQMKCTSEPRSDKIQDSESIDNPTDPNTIEERSAVMVDRLLNLNISDYLPCTITINFAAKLSRTYNQ